MIKVKMSPLAEVSRRWTPYNYCYSNPVYFVDPDGMIGDSFLNDFAIHQTNLLAGACMFKTDEDEVELLYSAIGLKEKKGIGKLKDDWISFTGKSGQQQIIYDSSVKGLAAAKAKYNNVKSVFASGNGHDTGTGEKFAFNSDGTYSIDGGRAMDVDDTSIITKGGTYIGESKGVIDAFGDFMLGGLQDTGDKMLMAAIPVAATGIGAPLAATMAEIGGIMSATGAGLEQINDFAENKFSFEKFITKGVIETASRKIGGSKVFGPLEKIVNDNVFNLLDNTIDSARTKK